MNKTSILLDTHPQRIGDFYAVCILLKRFPQISRVRLGTIAQRTQQDILIGLGGRFEPSDERMAFDVSKTHRNGPGNPLGLVLTYLGYYDTASYVWPWMYPLEILEDRGHRELVEHLNCGHEVPGKLASPLERAVFAEFQSSSEITEKDALFHEMIRYGDFLISEIIAAEAIDRWVAMHATMMEFGDIKVMLVPGKAPAPIEQAVNRLMLREHPEAACSVIQDTRGEGWTFFRFSHHHAKLDFTKVGSAHVIFSNSSGSLLKTRWRADNNTSIDDAELIEQIVRKATI